MGALLGLYFLPSRLEFCLFSSVQKSGLHLTFASALVITAFLCSWVEEWTFFKILFEASILR